MTELLTAAQMRAVERAAIESGEVTGLELMEVVLTQMRHQLDPVPIPELKHTVVTTEAPLALRGLMPDIEHRHVFITAGT